MFAEQYLVQKRFGRCCY